ncbi:MAG: helix-turn-helix domain-containing protein [Planctomycetes bacterium]|nr:helix-turn-helix domain-containing protein [Planctomycetota bacterium]
MARSGKREFFELVHGALEEGVEALESGRKLTVRDVELPGPPEPMSADEIATLRERTLGVSQRVFAAMLNASPQTVHAWEQGRKRPSGPALRLLELMGERTDLFVKSRPATRRRRAVKK